MIWLVKRTGLRPAKMVEIEVNEHENILNTLRILIPTKKRRNIKALIRNFPITLKDATTFKHYAVSRLQYLSVMASFGFAIKESNALFLGVSGRPIKKTSLERDFARIVDRADFGDEQVCLSMFRHRFITIDVIIHLKEFMQASGKGRQGMTILDCESVLKRVSVKTGHGSPDSLWHYIDLAWDEIEV